MRARVARFASSNALGLLRSAAVFIRWSAMAFAVALVVIAAAPRSPVTVDLGASRVSGLQTIEGTVPGVAVDRSARVLVRFVDPPIGLRLLHLGVVLPGLLLVAEIARRMATILRRAVDHDPFTPATARDLRRVAALTAIGGTLVAVIEYAAKLTLSSQALVTGLDRSFEFSPVGWLAVALMVAAFAQLVARGASLRHELATVI